MNCEDQLLLLLLEAIIARNEEVISQSTAKGNDKNAITASQIKIMNNTITYNHKILAISNKQYYNNSFHRT